jgi:transposase
MESAQQSNPDGKAKAFTITSVSCPDCGQKTVERYKRNLIEKAVSGITLGIVAGKKFRCLHCLLVFYKR